MLSPSERAQVRRLLMTDPATHAYALADLNPPYADAARWIIARARRDMAAVLLYEGLEPPILMAAGPPVLIAAALAKAHLPTALYISVQSEIYELLRAYYTFNDVRPMWRMALPRGAPARAAQAAPDLSVVPLTRADAPRLTALYALGGDFAPDAFDPYQLDDGAFFGIYAPGGGLVAAGGTHVIDVASGIAAVGNMYTHPAHRGRGMGRAVLHAVTAALRQRGIALIVLNVDQRNRAAHHLYRQFGFQTHCAYLEGNGVLRRPVRAGVGQSALH